MLVGFRDGSGEKRIGKGLIIFFQKKRAKNFFDSKEGAKGKGGFLDHRFSLHEHFLISVYYLYGAKKI